MMRTTPWERLQYQVSLADTREGRYIHVCVPIIVRQPYGYDTDTQSGFNMSDDLGEASIEWHVSTLRGNTRDVDTYLLTYGHVPPGVMLGDVLVGMNLRDHETMQAALKESNAYIEIDGHFFRPVSINAAGIGWIEEWAVTLRAHTPVYHAPGY